MFSARFRGATAAQARRVRHQVSDSDRPRGRDERDLGRRPATARRRWRRALRSGLHHRDFRVFELRDEARHRVCEADLAFLDQHQDGNGGDRLSHRSDPEDAVLAHRRLRFEIGHPLSLEVRNLAAPRDDRDGARDFLGADIALHDIVDARQPLGRQADILGLPVRDGSRERQREGTERSENDGGSPAADQVLHRRLLTGGWRPEV